MAWTPCAAAIACTMASPRPLPWASLAVRAPPGRSGRTPGPHPPRTYPGPRRPPRAARPGRPGPAGPRPGCPAGVRADVAEQVREHLADPCLVHHGQAAAVPRPAPGAPARPPGVGDRVPRPAPTGRYRPGRGRSPVQPGQLEQFGHERAHPLRLLLDPAHGVRQLVRAQRALPVQLGVTADGGQRGAQLVRGVGGELAHLLLGAQARAERLLDPVEHGVDGRPSRPTSVRSSASATRAVRSPAEVISLAVLAIWSSGSRPRPISHQPPITSSASSPPPVISSATTTAPTWLFTALPGARRRGCVSAERPTAR